MKSLEEVIGPNAPPTTGPERLRAFHERFEKKLRDVAACEAHLNSVLKFSDDDLAFEAVGDVITALKRNQLSARMSTLLADYLDQLDVDQCRQLLGVPRPSGRPNKSRASLLAVEAFVFASQLPGSTEVLALAAAYDAYDPGWDYARDSKCPRDVGRKTEPISVAQDRLDRWIKPLLRTAGCAISPTPKGRKPKVIGKPPPPIPLPT